jgi:hypothetical protein
MTEFPKRHARKYSDRAGLTSYRGSHQALINPRPNRIVLGRERGKSSKFHPKSYNQPKNNKVSRRKKESTRNKETKEKSTCEEQNNLQKERTISMVLWDCMRDDGHPLQDHTWT